MVLVIVAFISILAAVLMFVSYAGYEMRLADKQGKDNFYSAETVLDEINAGLQVEISRALSEAYQKVMINYALYETEAKRNEEFYNIYYAKLQDALQLDAAHPNQYNISTLRGYVTAEMLGDGSGADGSREKFGTYGAIVESNSKNASGDNVYTLSLLKTGILIKDLKVSYVNKAGYISIITTDIRIALPEANFSQTSAFPDINGYCLIADETLRMGSTFSGGKIRIKGDAYAGRMELGKTADGSLLSSAIYFEQPDGAEPDDLAVVVSREDISLNGGSLTTKQVELWGENLLLDAAKVNLQGSTNLKDDLELSGIGSEAVLSGEYAGYGNTEADAALSSAIVINGKDSLLDLSGLTSMNISGRSYVATAHKAENDATATEEEKKNSVNVTMGEAVAVKSNQLVYLAPPEALGCRILEDGSVGESAYGCNPLKLEQYEEIVNHPEQYVLLDGTRQIASLGYKSLDNYIKQETIAGGTSAYVPEVVFKQTNAGTLVYCYLRFVTKQTNADGTVSVKEDVEAANRYFVDYYKVNREQVDAYTSLYAKEIKIADTSTLLYLHLAGNMLAYSESTGSTLVDATDSYAQRKAANVISITKSDIHKALSAKMVTNISQLSEAEQGRHAFANIINEDKVKEIIRKFDTFGTGMVQIDTETPGNVKSTILSRYDYTVDDSTLASVKMIICLGNVTVKKDFEGLIISAADIQVDDSKDDNHEVVINTLSLTDFTEMLLAKKESGADVYYILDVFRDGVNYAYSGGTITDAGTQAVDLTDLIIYERWSKR